MAQKILIMGESGTGKSTSMSVVVKLFCNTCG